MRNAGDIQVVRRRLLAAAASLLLVSTAAVADEVTLEPTTTSETPGVLSPTEARTDNGTGALVPSTNQSLILGGFDNTDLGTITDVVVWVKYRTVGNAPSNDWYQFDVAVDGATYATIIVEQSTAEVTPNYVTASASVGAISWANVGTLAVRCLTNRSGGPDGYDVDWDVGYIVVTYTPTGNTAPTASAAAITGADDPLLPGIQYSITTQYSDVDGSDDLSDLYLAIDRDGTGPPAAPNDIIVRTAQGAAATGTATIDAGSGFLSGAVDYDKTEGSPGPNDITVTWTFTLDWNWFDDEPTVAEYGVRATDDLAADSGWELTDIDVDYENDLDYSGTLSVSAEDNGPITCGVDWVHGSETLTWSGLTAVYEGYGTSPPDVVDLQITDDAPTSWAQTAGVVLNLNTTSDSATDVSDIHDVDIVAIPAGGSDVSSVSCEIKVDATLPETLAGVATGSPGSNAIPVSWTAYGGGDAGAVGDSGFQTYRIYYSTATPVTTSDSVWDLNDDPALSSSATSSTTVTGLSSSTPYFFRVVGRDEAENEADINAAAEVTETTTAGGNNTPTASAGSITGADNPILAGIQYQLTTVYSDADGFADLDTLYLAIDRAGAAPSAPDDIVVRIAQGAGASGTATVDAGASFLSGSVTFQDKTETGNDITVSWNFTLNWDWFDDVTPAAEYGVRATDDQAADSGWDLTALAVDYENDLDLSGTLAVSGQDNGPVACGTDWVHGSETLTWTGLTVVYEGYGLSPANSDFDIQITDDDTGSWLQTTGAVLNLNTTSDAATTASDIHGVDIVGIPGSGADASSVTCEVRVDAGIPEVLADVATGAAGAGSIGVSWTAYGGGASGAVGDSGFQSYRVYYSTSTPVTTADPVWDANDDPALSGSSTSSTTVQGLSSDTPYFFRVVGLDQAENEGSVAGASEVTETTTAGAQGGTTVTSNTAEPSACQQITVTTIFTGDDNDNGSTRVEWSDTGSSGPWTVACPALTGASPRQCLITNTSDTTLPGGTVFVQVTHTDGDGVFGAPPNPDSTLSAALPACGSDQAPPTVLVLAPTRNAVVSGVDKAKVQVYDEFGLSGVTVQWSLDGGALATATQSANYLCPNETDRSVCAVYEFDLDTTGLANGGNYLTVEADDGTNTAYVRHGFRVNNKGAGMPGGAGTLLRRTHGSQLCNDCHNLSTHSSRTTSTDYGSWAVDCLACHTPHRTKNVFLVRQSLRTPNSDTKAVQFHVDDEAGETNPGSAVCVGGTDDGSECTDIAGDTDCAGGGDCVAPSPGDFGFLGDRSVTAGGQPNAPHDDGVCESCHTKTKFWRNTANDGMHAHNANVRCMKCHPHAEGFSAGGGGCTGCHGLEGDTGVGGANNRRPVLADFADGTGEPRSHHVGNGSGIIFGGQLTDFDCVVCHAEGRVNPANGETETVAAFHGGDGGSTTIDLKNADTWSDGSPAATAVFVYDKEAVRAAVTASCIGGDNNGLACTDISGDTDCPGGGDCSTLPDWSSANQVWREWTSGVDEGSGIPSNAGLDRFCLTCHDSDGATASFNSTDGGTASNPFGDSGVCQGGSSPGATCTDVTGDTDCPGGGDCVLVLNNYDSDVNATPATAIRGGVTDIKSRVSADGFGRDARCNGGTRDGLLCTDVAGDTDCPGGGDCVADGVCIGGDSPGSYCNDVAGDTDCPGGGDCQLAGRHAQGIADPPQGVYARHAIRGQSESVYETQQILTERWIQTTTAWNDVSVMGCADCHTTDGANGSQGNAHGSDSEYLLKDATGGATEGLYDPPTYTYVCYRCHNYQYYSRGELSDHSDNNSEWADKVLFEGAERRDNGKGANIFGMTCTNCHGGFGFGSIHGTSDQLAITTGGTRVRNAYRFTNGANLRFYDPQDWSGSSVSCWTIGTEDAWGGCTQHDREQTFTRTMTRALSY